MDSPRTRRLRAYTRGALWLCVLTVDAALILMGEDRYTSHLILAGIAANFIA